MRFAVLALALVAATLTGCAGAGVGWSAPASATGSASSSPPVATSTPEAIGTPFPTLEGPPAITLTPGGATSRIHFIGLVFDVPATWQVRIANVNMHYVTVQGFVGTAPSTAGCFPVAPPSGAVGATTCRADFNLGPGEVSIELLTQDGPPRMAPIGDPASLGAGDQVVLINGVPALRDGPRSLIVQSTADINQVYELRAEVMGPNADALWQQVAAAFDSVHYAEQPVLPDTSPANEARVLANALARFSASGPGYECFPAEPGGSRTARITQLPGMEAVAVPVNVVCRTEIQPTGAFWKLTLTAAWGAPGDPNASSQVSTYLLADGTPTWYSGASNPLP
jgi:hypothetical protein